MLSVLLKFRPTQAGLHLLLNPFGCKYGEVIVYFKPFWRCTANDEILCIFDFGKPECDLWKFFNNSGSAGAFRGCKN
jgi:hypothetical protein